VRMNRLASHRGPDGEDYWIWDGQSATGQFVESQLADQSEHHGAIALGSRRLQERLGMVEVLLERVDEVPRERHGKFRAVLCNLPAEEREHLRKAGQ
jgi:hypothetical protein